MEPIIVTMETSLVNRFYDEPPSEDQIKANYKLHGHWHSDRFLMRVIKGLIAKLPEPENVIIEEEYIYELTEEEEIEAFERALYATGNFTIDECTDLAEQILTHIKERYDLTLTPRL